MEDILNKYEVGQRIRQLRLQNDYTQAEFAEAVDISINFLSEIENGKKGLSQERLARICHQLHTSCDYILFGENAKQLNLIEAANSMSLEELKTFKEYLDSLMKMKKLQ
jgi:transcriptional regulator with XRE-family HTH domain